MVSLFNEGTVEGVLVSVSYLLCMDMWTHAPLIHLLHPSTLKTQQPQLIHMQPGQPLSRPAKLDRHKVG